MQNSPESLNPWLVSYISQQRHKQSRYEIDKYLIDAGCSPTEIELAWELVDQPSVTTKVPRLPKNILIPGIIWIIFYTPGFFFPSLYPIFWLGMIICLGFMFVGGLKAKKYSVIWGAPFIAILVTLRLFPSMSAIREVIQIIGLIILIITMFADAPKKQ